ncbi:MAG: RNB domain-containing ribonuclease, partial [Gammaproteobacteria bacterium]|nr:RNB domain-containing ribonuclease [Gammaproteobacteria bacterium]
MAVAKSKSKTRAKRGPKGDRVPRRGAILKCLAEQGEPTSLARLGKALGVAKGDKQVLEDRLGRMQNAGQVLVDRRGRYALPAKMDLLVGRIIGHPDGYGFLSVDTESDDLYLAPRQMRKVMHGDRVMARVARIDRRGRREAEIVEVTEWHNKTLVGRLVQEAGASFVTPQDRRISHDVLVAANARGGAKPGDIVVVEITQQPIGHRHPAGRVTEVLGAHLAPGMEVDIAIRKYDLPHRWPAGAQRDADAVADSVSTADRAKRRDLRELAFVTIDGEDARDYDDAVYCEPRGGGWRLIVAIADVSHYVTPGSILDAEARKRGNSVYFPNQVVPMLP